PYMRQGLTLRFEGKVASRPYIQMTIELMRHFGARVDWQGDTITVAPGSYRPASYTVESDWSAASYWYEIVALSADPDAWVSLPGLQSDSLQGDSCVADWFARLGVSTEYHSEGVVLRKTQADKSPLQLDFSLSPDLAQTLVVTCCLLGVPFEFSGLESLKIKETDRIAALCSECAKLGFVLEEPAHGCLRCDSRRPAVPCQAEIETYDDHRMAMAFAPAVLTGTALNILCPGVVSKSYPDFWKEFEQSAR
ncbi:MAG: 3-phosphoshikimate 1-carboxyvinyltransferase, partial [Paludibacteraceae bacterium]|nr:3-phosphoshikimate 1-carboxyvinyltransferase [Paludibacteraceae bacterium]